LQPPLSAALFYYTDPNWKSFYLYTLQCEGQCFKKALCNKQSTAGLYDWWHTACNAMGACQTTEIKRLH